MLLPPNWDASSHHLRLASVCPYRFHSDSTDTSFLDKESKLGVIVRTIIREFQKNEQRRENKDDRYNGAHWAKVSIWQGTKSDGGVGQATAARYWKVAQYCRVAGRRKIVMGTKNKTLSVCATSTIRLPPRPLAKTTICESYTCAAREA